MFTTIADFEKIWGDETESVRRILRLKFELGLFEKPFPSSADFDEVGHRDNRALDYEDSRESIDTF